MVFTVRREQRTAPFSRPTKSQLEFWQVIQNEFMKRKSTKAVKRRRFAAPNDTPLVEPTSTVASGQWEPRLIFRACPMTKEGEKLLGLQ